MRRLIFILASLWSITGFSFAQEIRETTTALGLMGVHKVQPGGEIHILTIGVTASDTAFVEGITLTLFDLAEPTGLIADDFKEIRLNRGPIPCLRSHNEIGKISADDLQIGQPVFIQASLPDTLSPSEEQFYIVSVVMSDSAVVDHAFKMAFPGGGLLTKTGILGTAVATGDSNNVLVISGANAEDGVSRFPFPLPGGDPVFIMLPEGETPFLVDFEDFVAFARAFGSQLGDDRFNIRADTDDDGVVGFTDFINFAGSFGKTAVGPASTSDPSCP